jgi:hypothetical protein
MEVRLSYQRFSYDRTPVTIGYDLTQLGWPASLNDQAVFRDLPVPVINGFDTNGTFGSQGAGSVIIDRNDNYGQPQRSRKSLEITHSSLVESSCV